MNKIAINLGLMSAILCAQLFTQFVSADGTGSHGGGGYLMKNELRLDRTGKYKTNPIYLVDLVEAKIPGELSPDGLNIPEVDSPVENQIQLALYRIQEWNSDIGDGVKRAFQEMSLIKLPKPKGFIIPPPTDVMHDLQPIASELVGLARWNDEKKRVTYDPYKIEKLPLTHEAALWVHEAVYRFFRTDSRYKSSENSKAARRLVGWAFSDKPVTDWAPLYRSRVMMSEMTYREGLSDKYGNIKTVYSIPTIVNTEYLSTNFIVQFNFDISKNPSCEEKFMVLGYDSRNRNYLPTSVKGNQLQQLYGAIDLDEVSKMNILIYLKHSYRADNISCPVTVEFIDSNGFKVWSINLPNTFYKEYDSIEFEFIRSIRKHDQQYTILWN